ncbi:hypothetical protein BC831DRAFT_3222 [Entophlyctis helioformis]|nr:hypothetical protein BC831DRAFT_3222 [Entophlyctis helioformis]
MPANPSTTRLSSDFDAMVHPFTTPSPPSPSFLTSTKSRLLTPATRRLTTRFRFQWLVALSAAGLVTTPAVCLSCVDRSMRALRCTRLRICSLLKSCAFRDEDSMLSTRARFGARALALSPIMTSCCSSIGRPLNSAESILMDDRSMSWRCSA